MRINAKYFTTSSFEHQSFAGNGATTAFALTYEPITIKAVYAHINGLVQRPTTDFTLSGSTITFVAAPAAEQDIDIYYLRK